MKNNIYNPLFESLLKKVNDYENPQEITEQDSAGKGSKAIFSDYMKSISQLGAKLIAQYANAVQTYPKTAAKAEYMKTFPDKLNAMVSSIDDTKTPGIQLEALFNTVKAEATTFFGLGAKEDKRLVKHLEPWRDSFRSGFQLYTQAFKSLMDYVKKEEVTNQAQIGEEGKAMMKAAASKFVTSLVASFEKNKTITDTKWGEPVVKESYASGSVIEKLIQNKICVDFNTFNTVINEAKEDRVARRAAKAIRPQIEALQANITNVLNQIGGRLGDPAKANFKSLAMAPEFNKIANTLVSIQDELSVEKAELKNVQFDDLNKQVENLVDLFNSKKESYDKTYAEEEKSLRSYKTLQVATPEVVKFIEDGDAQFTALSDLAQNGANLFSADLAKEKADKDQAAKLKGESQPKNPGKKDGEVQKGQDGFDYKWDDKAKVWNKVEEEDKPQASIGAKVESAPVAKADVPKGKKSDEVKKFQEGVIAKYAKDKRISATEPYKRLKQSLDSGQGGYFGPRTDAMVNMLKAGFKISDGNSDITKDLLDKINAQGIKESFIFEQDFDYDAAEKFAGTSTGSTAAPKKKSSGKKAAEAGSKEDIPAAKEENVMKDKEIKTPIDASKIEKATKELLLAMTGAYEDEDRVYDVFQKSITTKDEFEALRQSWNSMKILPEDLQKAESVWKGYTVAQLAERNKGRTKLVTLQLLFKNSFNNDEINRLNSYLPDGVKKI